MPRGALTFRQRDLTAAGKGVAAAGFKVVGVEVDKRGKIIVHTNEAAIRAPEAEAGSEKNEWDAVLTEEAVPPKRRSRK